MYTAAAAAVVGRRPPPSASRPPPPPPSAAVRRRRRRQPSACRALEPEPLHRSPRGGPLAAGTLRCRAGEAGRPRRSAPHPRPSGPNSGPKPAPDPRPPGPAPGPGTRSAGPMNIHIQKTSARKSPGQSNVPAGMGTMPTWSWRPSSQGLASHTTPRWRAILTEMEAEGCVGFHINSQTVRRPDGGSPSG
jgi:hypothetical protein